MKSQQKFTLNSSIIVEAASEDSETWNYKIGKNPIGH